jgi:hypothetical protein
VDNLASLSESGSTSRAFERASLDELNGKLQPDSWLSTAIEEYKSIRTESLDSMKVQNNIVGYGVAATAALLTASIGFIDKNDSTILDLAIFCLFIPSVISFIVMIWAGEVARMYRAGSFLAMREKIINRHIDGKINSGGLLSESLGWENWLLSEDANNKNQTPHHRLYAQHYYILVMFICLGLLSMLIGNYKGYPANPVIFFIFDILVVSGLATLAVLALSILRHFQPQIAPWILLIGRRAPWSLRRRTG